MIWIKSYICISFVDWPKFWNFCISEVVLGTYQVLKIHTNKYGKSLLDCMPYVLKVCSHANMSCMLTCSHANVSYMLTCQHPLHAHALMSLAYLYAHIPMFLMCLHAPGKNLGKFTIYFGMEVIPRLFWTAFSFSPVLIQQALILLVKIHNSKLQISEMWLIQLG